jgi:hypothetical protein
MNCNKEPKTNRLVQVHLKSWQHIFAADRTANLSLKVCEQCLVGYNIPLQRKGVKKWEFGIINNYDDNSDKYQAVFINKEEDWVTIADDPFADYIRQCQKQNCQQKLANNKSTTLNFANSFEFGEEARSSGEKMVRLIIH